jgi:hypothetical protein
MLYVFPELNVTPATANFHIPKLLETYRMQWGGAYAYIKPEQLLTGSFIRDDVAGQCLFVNWLDLLYASIFDRRLALFSLALPSPIVDVIAYRLHQRLKSSFIRLKERGVKIIFYFHDLHTFSRIPLYKSLDSKFRRFLYEVSDCVLFAENSAYSAVRSVYGPCTHFELSQLGSYAEAHGPLPNKTLCRHKLGIKSGSTTILAIGTLRTNRKADVIVDAVAAHNDLFLLAGGRGHKDISTRNIKSFGGYVPNDHLLLMLGAADYVLHLGKNYLTSATIRLALSYDIPVIAEAYGATTDMCGGALIDLADFGFDVSRLLEKLPRNSSTTYLSLKKHARCSDSLRTWEKAAETLHRTVTSLSRKG